MESVFPMRLIEQREKESFSMHLKRVYCSLLAFVMVMWEFEVDCIEILSRSG